MVRVVLKIRPYIVKLRTASCISLTIQFKDFYTGLYLLTFPAQKIGFLRRKMDKKSTPKSAYKFEPRVFKITIKEWFMFSYLKIPLRITFFISIFCIAPQLTKVLLIYSCQPLAGSYII